MICSETFATRNKNFEVSDFQIFSKYLKNFEKNFMGVSANLKKNLRLYIMYRTLIVYRHMFIQSPLIQNHKLTLYFFP